jgi:hypothetical protein
MRASPIVSEHVMRAYKILSVIPIISGSPVFKAILIGIINYGMTKSSQVEARGVHWGFILSCCVFTLLEAQVEKLPAISIRWFCFV